MELLGKIFGNAARVKIMRLFLFNEGEPYTLETITKRTHVRKEAVRKELTQLTAMGFVEKKDFTEKVALKPTRAKPEGSTKKVARKGWMLDTRFELIDPLRDLLIETELINTADITNRLKLAGKLDLVILSGIFLRDDNRKLDLLIVGDKVKSNVLSRQISVLESEIGRELSYAHFDKEEFKYRMGMYDKLLRDVLENNHKTLVNKMGL